MYKAGDFTNGKMNEMFRMAFSDGAIDIKHKQLGEFSLINKEAELHYLLTPLEIVHGIYYITTESGTKLMSVLDSNSDDIREEHPEVLDADQYKANDLLNGLMFLSDEYNKPRPDNDSYASRCLMRIMCNNDNLMSCSSIHNANKDTIIKSLCEDGNTSSKKIVVKFLDDNSHHKANFFSIVCDSVINAAITSIESNDQHWNIFEFSNVYFDVTSAYDKKLKQEMVSVCMEHLINQKIINRLCHDTYEININTINLNY